MTQGAGKSFDYDVAIIGSGFGGSVAALRLTQKGYRVVVLEAGARFDDKDFAKTSFDLKRFLFFPKLGMLGIQRIDFLKNGLRQHPLSPASRVLSDRLVGRSRRLANRACSTLFRGRAHARRHQEPVL